jgi:hypothetical protein
MNLYFQLWCDEERKRGVKGPKGRDVDVFEGVLVSSQNYYIL